MSVVDGGGSSLTSDLKMLSIMLGMAYRSGLSSSLVSVRVPLRCEESRLKSHELSAMFWGVWAQRDSRRGRITDVAVITAEDELLRHDNGDEETT